MNFNAINAFDASTRRPVKHKHIVLYIRLNFQTIFFFNVAHHVEKICIT